MKCISAMISEFPILLEKHCQIALEILLSNVGKSIISAEIHFALWDSFPYCRNAAKHFVKNRKAQILFFKAIHI